MRFDALHRLWERLRASGGSRTVLDSDSFTESEREVGRMVLPLISDLATAQKTIGELTGRTRAIDALLRILPAAALIIDEQGRLVSSNTAAKELFGGPAIPVHVVELATRVIRAGEERTCEAFAHPRRPGATLRIVPAEPDRQEPGPGVVFLVAPEGDRGIGADEVAQRLQLTAMQGRVVALIARGLSNREVGERLGVSVETVRKHLAAVYQKTGVPNRAGIVALAYGARFGARAPLASEK